MSYFERVPRLSSSGFVLVTVLLFLQVFSLISLYGLMYASTTMKRNDHLWYGYNDRLKSNQFLQKLESGVVLDPAACNIPVTPSPVLARKPISWWQLHTCSANADGIRYYYAVESLGDDPCGVTEKGNRNQWLIANYYRITLFMLPDKLKGAKYLLQSTIALSGVQALACEGNLHRVKPGRQTWREI